MSNSQYQDISGPFSGKTITLGVCGGIAAYRACDLIRELYRQGARRVFCVMTQSATQFITVTTLQALSHEAVYPFDASIVSHTDSSSDEIGLPIHIKLAQQSDLFLILAATANTIGKLANGLADDLLSTTFMTFTDKPVLLAPAMNTRMWRHPIFQDNLKRLTALPNVSLCAPDSGLLACGETGEGHLASQDTILRHAYKALHFDQKVLAGKKILVTAGGTSEAIDPVRFITNRSSGKMGIALADEAWAMGADVTLLTSVANIQRPYAVQAFTDTQDLKSALEIEWPSHDWLLMAAAVSDFRPAETAQNKIKKPIDPASLITLDFLPNPDLLANLGQIKQPHQKLIGFAAESDNVIPHAQEKLQRKNLDAIAVNDISRADIGFQVDDNELTVLMADGTSAHLPKTSKRQISWQLLSQLKQAFSNPSSVGQSRTIDTLTENWALYS